MSLKLLATFPDITEASIYAGRLEADGIPCTLDNAIFSSIYPVGGPLGDVRLMVRSEDYERALALLAPAEGESQ